MQYVGDINDLGQIAASISMRLAATASSIAGGVHANNDAAFGINEVAGDDTWAIGAPGGA